MVFTVKNKKWEDVWGMKYLYNGEVDLSNKECGFGTAIRKDDRNLKF